VKNDKKNNHINSKIVSGKKINKLGFAGYYLQINVHLMRTSSKNVSLIVSAK